MWPGSDLFEIEKFLAEKDKLNVRFRELVEDNGRHYLHVTPASDHGMTVYKIPESAAEELSRKVDRVGTLLRLERIKLHVDCTLSAEQVSISNEERFRFEVLSWKGTSKDKIYTFTGRLDVPKGSQDFTCLGSVTLDVALHGQKAQALKTLFADKQRYDYFPVEVFLDLDGLEETERWSFRQAKKLELRQRPESDPEPGI